MKNFFFNNIKEVTDMHSLPLVLEVALESDFRRGQIVSRRGILGKTGNLFLVVSGQWKAEICGEEQMMNPGDLFYALFRDGYRAECLSEYGKVRIVGFHGPLAEAILLSYSFPRFLSLVDDIEAIWKELVAVLSSNSQMVLCHGLALFLDIFSHVGKPAGTLNSYEELFKQALDLIQQQLSNPELGVNYLCEKLLISRSKLTEIFHRYFKWSPGREILNRKLARAYSLLRGTDYPVAKIARECGFRDPKTFSRFIRRASGCGPREFRERHRRENEKPAPAKDCMEPV